MHFFPILNSKLLKIVHFLPKIFEKVHFLNILKQKILEKVQFFKHFQAKLSKKAKNDHFLHIFYPETAKINVFLLEKLHF